MPHDADDHARGAYHRLEGYAVRRGPGIAAARPPTATAALATALVARSWRRRRRSWRAPRAPPPVLVKGPAAAALHPSTAAAALRRSRPRRHEAAAAPGSRRAARRRLAARPGAADGHRGRRAVARLRRGPRTRARAGTRDRHAGPSASRCTGASSTTRAPTRWIATGSRATAASSTARSRPPAPELLLALALHLVAHPDRRLLMVQDVALAARARRRGDRRAFDLAAELGLALGAAPGARCRRRARRAWPSSGPPAAAQRPPLGPLRTALWRGPRPVGVHVGRLAALARRERAALRRARAQSRCSRERGAEELPRRDRPPALRSSGIARAERPGRARPGGHHRERAGDGGAVGLRRIARRGSWRRVSGVEQLDLGLVAAALGQLTTAARRTAAVCSRPCRRARGRAAAARPAAAGASPTARARRAARRRRRATGPRCRRRAARSRAAPARPRASTCPHRGAAERHRAAVAGEHGGVQRQVAALGEKERHDQAGQAVLEQPLVALGGHAPRSARSRRRRGSCRSPGTRRAARRRCARAPTSRRVVAHEPAAAPRSCSSVARTRNCAARRPGRCARAAAAGPIRSRSRTVSPP